MPADNRISITISQELKSAIDTEINNIKTKLQPFLIALTPDERRALPKMSDKSIAFVNKALNYAGSNPEFVPPFLDLAEMKKDIDAVEVLNGIAKSLAQITTGLDDTITLAGSESYVASLSYYNSVKQAVKRDIPNAKSISDDLSERFTSKTKKTEAAPAT
jgi:hypothetical protein